MTISLWIRGVMLALLLNATAGCGYRLTNAHSTLAGTAQSIWVPFFSNESNSPTAQTVFRRAFYDELHAVRGLNPSASEEGADLVMKARIVSYSSKVVSYTAIDRVREYSLVVEVELEISRKGQTAPLWKGVLHGTKQYPANADLALQQNAEEQALDAAARIIARKFITTMEESY